MTPARHTTCSVSRDISAALYDSPESSITLSAQAPGPGPTATASWLGLPAFLVP
ncbi:hypothetical protein RUND412_011111, partial [Rhizina undulata]